MEEKLRSLSRSQLKDFYKKKKRKKFDVIKKRDRDERK